MNATVYNNMAAEIFGIMSEFYKPPSQELWEDLRNRNLSYRLSKAASDLYGSDPALTELTVPDSLEQLMDIYSATLSNSKRGAALPIESIYKTWTMDETCTLPFAKSKGYLNGDPAHHIKFILEDLQIEIPIEYSGSPDHLTILLELLSYFIEHAQEEFTRQFLADHFDWLEDFELAVRQLEIHPFYQQVTQNLIELVKLQHHTY